MPGVVADDDGLDDVGVDRRRGHDVEDALAVETEIEEDPVVAELEVAVEQADLPAELAMEGDGRVDRDRRRPHAALGAVERGDPAEDRPADAGLRAARTGRAGSSSGPAARPGGTA